VVRRSCRETIGEVACRRPCLVSASEIEFRAKGEIFKGGGRGEDKGGAEEEGGGE
jgi:hypothetical protein